MMYTDAHQGSFIELRKQEVILRLKANVFPTRLWQWLSTGFGQAWSEGLLRRPFQTMSCPDGRTGEPRWKRTSLDLLSYLIFSLMVPGQHPLVRVWQLIDWQAINRLAGPAYRNQRFGQRAWAPAQLVALLLLLVLLPARSETALLQQVAIVPLYRWFCGFSLFAPLPDHSSLHTFRKRMGVERFEAILTWVVLRCQQAGLIANEQAFFDMTGVAASAHRFSPYERAVLLTHALIRYLERSAQHPEELLSESVREAIAQVALEAQDNEGLKKSAHLAPRLLHSLERWTGTSGQPLWEQTIEEAVSAVLAESDPYPAGAEASSQAWRTWLMSIAQRLKGGLPQARGDREARVGWTSDVNLMCGYWLGFLVDSLRQVITAVRLVPLNQMQHDQMIPALDQHQERLGAYPQEVVADSAQDYDLVHQDLKQRQIQGQIPSQSTALRGGGWGPGHFRYTLQDQLICPNGEVLEAGPARQDGLRPHRAKDCSSCPWKAECLPKGQQPDGPRVIYLVPETHRRWLQNRDNTRTLAYQKAQKQRFASEGRFGLAERLHHAKKAPYRSAAMNRMAGILVGIALNLAILLPDLPGVEP